MSALWIIIGVVGWLACWATAVRFADLVGSQDRFDREMRKGFVGFVGVFTAPVLVVALVALLMASRVGAISGIRRYMNPVQAREDAARQARQEKREEAREYRAIARRTEDPAERELLLDAARHLENEIERSY